MNTRPLPHRLSRAAVCVLAVAVWGLLEPRAETLPEKIEHRYIPSAQGFIASWLQLGPLTAPRQPKGQVDFLADWDPLGTVGRARRPSHGAVGAGVSWRARSSRSKGIHLRGPHPALAYLTVMIEVSRERRLWLSTGSDGGIEVWLNGERLLRRELKRRAVPDNDLVALDLPAGESTLLLRIWKADPGPWRVYARLMDEGFDVPKDVSVVLPGAKTRFDRAVKQSGRLIVQRIVDLDEGAVDTRLALTFDGGRPVGDKLNSRVTFTGPEQPATLESVIDFSAQAPADVDFGTIRFKKERKPSTVRAQVGQAAFEQPFSFQMASVKGLAEAWADLRGALDREDIPRSSLESAAWRIEHLKSLIQVGDGDFRYIVRETKNTVAIARALAEGRDPYAGRRREVQRRGYRSSVDGSLQYYALYVPPGWREEGDRRYGLVVSLHGLNSTPMKAMQAVFGQPLDEGETKLMRERHPKAVGATRFFVLAPSGFGNAGYRVFGEVDVLEAIEAVRGRYRIDSDRIFITGASMGGIGAGSIPLHFPDSFAAAAPLCGYHSLSTYRSLRGKELKPWEAFLAGFRSNDHWAANGRHLPLYVVHGLKDNPRHSRVLVDRYRKLGYKVKFDTPDLGHNVWDQVYENRNIFRYFRSFKRVSNPRNVTFRTAHLRYRSAHWVRIDDAINYSRWLLVEAEWGEDNTIDLKTENLGAVTIQNVSELGGERPVVLNIDGQRFEGSPSEPSWAFRKRDARWEKGPVASCPGLCKRPGLAGPMDDALYEPLLFVYGTAHPGEERLARRLIDELKRPRRGVTVDWPVKADVDVSEADIAEKSIVVVGTPGGNRLLDRIQDKLPIRIKKGGVQLGEQRFEGDAVAASFIYPNPLNPERYTVVYTGVTLQALFHAAHLPQLLPDYIVYNTSDWNIKGGLVLGDRQVLAAGFFNRNWTIE